MTVEKGLISKSKMTALKTAIQAKTGQTGGMTADQMATAIGNIPSGGITPTGTKQVSITQNGTTTEDVTNYASAEITVNVPSSGITPSGTIQITENGTVDVTQYASAAVNVSGGGGASWVTVAEQTLAEDAAEIVLSGDFGSYDIYEVVITGRTSTAEWIYPIFSSSGSKVNYIGLNTASGDSTFSGVTMRIAKVNSGVDSCYVSALHRTTTAVATYCGVSFSYMKLVLYNASSKFKSGFNVKIRGLNYSI